MFMKNILMLIIGISILNSSVQAVNPFQPLEFRPIEKGLIYLEDVSSAEVIEEQGNIGLGLTLTEEGKEKMKSYTSKNIGKDLALIINGNITSIREIKSPIEKGKLFITPYDKLEAQKIIELISAK